MASVRALDEGTRVRVKRRTARFYDSIGSPRAIEPGTTGRVSNHFAKFDNTLEVWVWFDGNNRSGGWVPIRRLKVLKGNR